MIRLTPALLAVLLLVSACSTNAPSETDRTAADLPTLATAPTADYLTADYSGHTAVLGYAERITDPLSGEAGGIEWFQKDVGNGQLGHDFVYGDPRNAVNDGGYAGVSYGIKTDNTSDDVNLENQDFWFRESVDVWNQERCATLALQENDVDSATPGVVENFFAGGGIDISLVEADLTQIGFRGVSPIFPAGTSTLGVAYTLFWTDASGNLTDIDGNGKLDVAFREIYYNDQYDWADNGLEGRQPDGTRLFDFPTVAIHEVGHGLSSAHFGNIGVKDGFLFAKPRTVMNAIYGGTLRELTGRDAAAHCANWAQWPNN